MVALVVVYVHSVDVEHLGFVLNATHTFVWIMAMIPKYSLLRKENIISTTTSVASTRNIVMHGTYKVLTTQRKSKTMIYSRLT